MGILFGLLSVILTSAMPVVNKFILQTTSPILGAFTNASFSALFFIVIEMVRQRSLRLHLTLHSASSGFFNGLALMLLFMALQHMHPAVLGFVGRLGVVYALLLSTLVLGQRPDKIEILLGTLAVGGALGSAIQDWNGTSFLDLALAMGSTLSFSISNLNLKLASKKKTNNQVLAAANFISALTLLIFCFISPAPIKIPRDLQSWTLILSGAFFGSCLGIWCYIQSLKYLTFSRASLFRATGPLFTAAISYPFFGLPMSTMQVVSAFILLLSIILLGTYERRVLESPPHRQKSLKPFIFSHTRFLESQSHNQ